MALSIEQMAAQAGERLRQEIAEAPIQGLGLANRSVVARDPGWWQEEAKPVAEDTKAMEDCPQCTVEFHSVREIEDRNAAYRKKKGDGYCAVFSPTKAAAVDGGAFGPMKVCYSDPGIEEAVAKGTVMLVPESLEITHFHTNQPQGYTVTVHGIVNRGAASDAPMQVPIQSGKLLATGGVVSNVAAFDSPLKDADAALIRLYGGNLCVGVPTHVTEIVPGKYLVPQHSLLLAKINRARDARNEAPLASINHNGEDIQQVIVSKAEYDEHNLEVEAVKKKFFSPMVPAQVAFIVEPAGTADASGEARKASFASPLNKQSLKSEEINVQLGLTASVKCRVLQIKKPAAVAAASIKKPTLAAPKKQQQPLAANYGSDDDDY